MRKGKTGDCCSHVMEGSHTLSGFSIPDFVRAIITSRNNPLAIWRENNRANPTCVSFKSSHTLSGFSIPDFDRAIITSRDNPLAIWREGNREYPTCVSLKQFLCRIWNYYLCCSHG